ncbi:zona pellucida sperm-binding protein 3-like [Heterodontus francisci]|uniref:zona pellucida sperm-binding protein 3-like n=1 Tax=Heterodontus francisci TaxID=7792 RepID=UPI00355B0CFE
MPVFSSHRTIDQSARPAPWISVGSAHQSSSWINQQSLTVTVQCGEQNLLVRVQMDLFGSRHLIKAADLTLGTAGCRPTRIYSQNHTVLFDYGLHECGSRLQMAGDFLVYTTHLNHTPQYHGSVIVRTNGAVIPIECHYFRKGNVSSNPIKPTWIPFSSTKSGEGHLSFSLRLMNDDWLTERTSTVYYLGDLIHIEASVSMTNHMPLKLYIDRCVATLSPDKDSTPRYSIIDYNGCLLDSKAEDSFSTFVLPRDERELDKLRFDLDAFRFFGDDRSLIFITCHLKVAPVDRRDSMNKACTFQKMQNVWTPLEESNNDICACCHVGNCGVTREFRFPSRGRRDLSEAGLKWEGEASLGPLVILDTEVTDLATESLNEVEQRLQERSPGGVESEVVLIVALTVTAVCLISASLIALFLYRKHKLININTEPKLALLVLHYHGSLLINGFILSQVCYPPLYTNNEYSIPTVAMCLKWSQFTLCRRDQCASNSLKQEFTCGHLGPNVTAEERQAIGEDGPPDGLQPGPGVILCDRVLSFRWDVHGAERRGTPASPAKSTPAINGVTDVTLCMAKGPSSCTQVRASGQETSILSAELGLDFNRRG